MRERHIRRCLKRELFDLRIDLCRRLAILLEGLFRRRELRIERLYLLLLRFVELFQVDLIIARARRIDGRAVRVPDLVLLAGDGLHQLLEALCWVLRKLGLFPELFHARDAGRELFFHAFTDKRPCLVVQRVKGRLCSVHHIAVFLRQCIRLRKRFDLRLHLPRRFLALLLRVVWNFVIHIKERLEPFLDRFLCCKLHGRHRFLQALACLRIVGPACRG